jgi:hypothetical protein
MYSMLRFFVPGVALAILFAACQPSTFSIEVRNARAPATPPAATVGAVYVELVVQQKDVLLGASSPNAERVEMHSTTEQDGVMMMRPIESVALAEHSEVKFEPGGMHLMLMGLNQPLSVGTKFPLTFRFRNAGEVVVEVDVIEPGEAAGGVTR